MKMKKVFLLAAVASVAGSAWLASENLRRGDDLFQENLEVLTDGEVFVHHCFKSITESTDPYEFVFYCGSCCEVHGKPTFFSGTGTCNN